MATAMFAGPARQEPTELDARGKFFLSHILEELDVPDMNALPIHSEFIATFDYCPRLVHEDYPVPSTVHDRFGGWHMYGTFTNAANALLAAGRKFGYFRCPLGTAVISVRDPENPLIYWKDPVTVSTMVGQHSRFGEEAQHRGALSVTSSIGCAWALAFAEAALLTPE